MKKGKHLTEPQLYDLFIEDDNGWTKEQKVDNRYLFIRSNSFKIFSIKIRIVELRKAVIEELPGLVKIPFLIIKKLNSVQSFTKVRFKMKGIDQDLFTLISFAEAEYLRDYKVSPNTIFLTVNTVRQLWEMSHERKMWSVGDSGEYKGMTMIIVSNDHKLNGGNDLFFEIGYMGRVV